MNFGDFTKTGLFIWLIFFLGNFMSSLFMCLGIKLFNFKKIFPFFNFRRVIGLVLLFLALADYLSFEKPCFTDLINLNLSEATSITRSLFISFTAPLTIYLGATLLCLGISLFNFQKIFPIFTFKKVISLFMFTIGYKFAIYGLFFHC